MSVSDPLLKVLKGHVVALRLCPDIITDSHPSLKPLCETLELIFVKGLHQNSSLFGLTRRDYWHWIESFVGENASRNRMNPTLTITVDTVKSSKLICTVRGRGRYFIRLALQKKLLGGLVEHLVRNKIMVVARYFNAELSIIGHEILGEIFLSLLYEIGEIRFQLKTQNASFLDDTWILPVYKQYEFVPCTKLGIHVQHVDGHVLTMKVDEGSIAEEDEKICPGDVLVELFGEPLKRVAMGKIGSQLRGNLGSPINLAIVKCRQADNSLFPPIAEMLRKCDNNASSVKHFLGKGKIEQIRSGDKMPPHAQLPEDEYTAVPVHNAADMAEYRVNYRGKTSAGSQGGVEQIDTLIKQVITAASENIHEDVGDVILQLGETQVNILEPSSRKVLVSHSYTEVSCCGRLTEQEGECFIYIAGETTCNMAQEFVGYVFTAETVDEAKTIVCTIAQGFDRTHWFV
ncbi:hypothetical protein LSAT2_004478 [Lamellibrachia satsuma]|nr:hypothetical protein LSAT2_004478 [Lamellibrachia satsuma]